jgi:hypothetical protein
VATAILREIDRGGQVFFVHNRVQTIEAMHRYLTKIVPQAQIAVAHGQMHERSLEGIMLAFLSRRYNVLLCTAIIESGLDIPSANTIIINRADRFGLARCTSCGKGRTRAASLRVSSHPPPGYERRRHKGCARWKRLRPRFGIRAGDAGSGNSRRGTILGRVNPDLSKGFDLATDCWRKRWRNPRGNQHAGCKLKRILKCSSTTAMQRPSERDIYRRLADSRTLDDVENS